MPGACTSDSVSNSVKRQGITHYSWNYSYIFIPADIYDLEEVVWIQMRLYDMNIGFPCFVLFDQIKFYVK